jgi:RHS repeat-associated protein
MTKLKKFAKALCVALLCTAMVNNAMAAVVTYYHNDISGSPIAATDAAGNLKWKESYKPYGDKLTRSIASSDNDIGFHGKAHDDSTGLSYMGARYYDPVLGRFMGIDPVHFQTDNLHSFNRYAYTNNNPYKYVDPDGRFAFLIVPALFALTALAAAATVNSMMNGGGFNQGMGGDDAGAFERPITQLSDVPRTTTYHNESSDRTGGDRDNSDKNIGIPESPEGKLSVRSDKWWDSQGISPHAEKDGYGDSKRNLAVDKNGNVWTVDRIGSGNPEYIGKLKDMRK